jgi:hypothetical protein
MTATNKRLLIFESCGDSNRCTPCRGKPDQHNTYASHASPCTPGVRFLRVVPYVVTFHESLTELDIVIAPLKKGSRHNPQLDGWPIHGSVPNFSPKPANEAVEKAKTSINNRLLGWLKVVILGLWVPYFAWSLACLECDRLVTMGQSCWAWSPKLYFISILCADDLLPTSGDADNLYQWEVQTVESWTLY